MSEIILTANLEENGEVQAIAKFHITSLLEAHALVELLMEALKELQKDLVREAKDVSTPIIDKEKKYDIN